MVSNPKYLWDAWPFHWTNEYIGNVSSIAINAIRHMRYALLMGIILWMIEWIIIDYLFSWFEYSRRKPICCFIDSMYLIRTSGLHIINLPDMLVDDVVATSDFESLSLTNVEDLPGTQLIVELLLVLLLLLFFFDFQSFIFSSISFLCVPMENYFESDLIEIRQMIIGEWSQFCIKNHIIYSRHTCSLVI